MNKFQPARSRIFEDFRLETLERMSRLRQTRSILRQDSLQGVLREIQDLLGIQIISSDSLTVKEMCHSYAKQSGTCLRKSQPPGARVYENAIWTDQLNNTANTEAHYQTTGPEIWEQTEGSATTEAIGPRVVSPTIFKSIAMVYEMLDAEGLYLGASSALNVIAAVECSAVAMILCDGAYRYQSRLFSKKWL
ncbi:hypothetical protein NEOLEDRAFT_1150200 [Neolentinus lepideus HHB14362 ss-1]|uniref:Uncharacterized protein n=1 Tax=Neolentinus lepideus HHB14362 ss-1 TaxID=1314782 RepID=A0A165QCB2_9AGAM|nr:hypothetical protein NEOLEDRAFT_1150200 [Neolentinus lepideus HHB14362 ss-1]